MLLESGSEAARDSFRKRLRIFWVKNGRKRAERRPDMKMLTMKVSMPMKAKPLAAVSCSSSLMKKRKKEAIRTPMKLRKLAVAMTWPRFSSGLFTWIKESKGIR